MNTRYLALFSVASGKNHSTETAAVAFSDFVRKGMDQGLLTGGVFVDLRKAFDSVDHALLVNKLMSYGLSNTEVNWFWSNELAKVNEWLLNNNLLMHKGKTDVSFLVQTRN